MRTVFFRLPFPKPIKRQTLLTQYALKYNYPSGLGINRITFPFSRGRWETRVLRNLVLVAESPGQTGHGRGLEGGGLRCNLLHCTADAFLHLPTPSSQPNNCAVYGLVTMYHNQCISLQTNLGKCITTPQARLNHFFLKNYSELV